MPVARRPPWVKTSQRPGAAALASMATTMHWLPNFSAASRDEFGPRHGGGVDRGLVGAGEQQPADILDRAHAAADGQRHEALLGGAAHHVVERVAIVGRGGDVEKAQLVGAFAVVEARLLDRIAGIDQIDEIDALDDAAVLDVETGDDAHLQHRSRLRSQPSAPRADRSGRHRARGRR